MEYIARSRAKNGSPKAPAHCAVRRAVRRGELVPQPCETCGTTPTHGHHDDYSKPLDVRWLCRSCHYKAHHPTIELEPIDVVLEPGWSARLFQENA